MNKILEKMPDVAPDGPLDQQKGKLYHHYTSSHTLLDTKSSSIGPLSIIGDPLGQVADKALKPVGAITGGKSSQS